VLLAVKANSAFVGFFFALLFLAFYFLSLASGTSIEVGSAS